VTDLFILIEDPYEDYPDDEDTRDEQGKDVQESPELALQIAKKIKEVAAKLYKDGRKEDALRKWQSAYHSVPVSQCFDYLIIVYNLSEAIRYLDVHPVLSEIKPEEFKKEYDAVLIPLLTNTALATLDIPRPEPQVALSSTTRALGFPSLTPAQRGMSYDHVILVETNPTTKNQGKHFISVHVPRFNLKKTRKRRKISSNRKRSLLMVPKRLK
jgi:hypothetical protein